MTTCPQCNRKIHFVCGNPDCASCAGPHPEGSGKMIIQPGGNNLTCPFCGFTESGSFWDSLDIDAFISSMGANTLLEALEIDKRNRK